MGTKLSLTVANGRGGAPAVVLVSAGTAAVPLQGGCALLLGPPFAPAFALQLPGGGSATVAFGLPYWLPPVVLSWQAAILDDGPRAGFTLTNGLTASVL